MIVTHVESGSYRNSVPHPKHHMTVSNVGHWSVCSISSPEQGYSRARLLCRIPAALRYLRRIAKTGTHNGHDAEDWLRAEAEISRVVAKAAAWPASTGQ